MVQQADQGAARHLQVHPRPDAALRQPGLHAHAKKAEGTTITINLDFPDIDERHTLFLENSVLNHWPNHAESNTDAKVTLDRSTLNSLLGKATTLEEAIAAGKVKVEGNKARFADLVGSLTNLNDSFWFNIVTPNLPASGAIGRALK